MTHQEMTSHLVQVLRALNSIPVTGRTNLSNMAGSIGVIEEIVQALSSEDEEKAD